MMSDDEFARYSVAFPGIGKDRFEFILTIANDTWVTGDEKEFEAQLPVWRSREIEFVTTCSNPRELFAFVDLYNWDKGYDLLKAVAVNPACDLSTALAMFWTASPEHYQQYGTRDDVREYELDAWDFIMGVLGRLNEGVYRPPASSFDPREWDAEQANGPNSKWQIPPSLFHPIVV